ncbi:phosphoenolpyruvate carboxylase [Shigella flexneri]
MATQAWLQARLKGEEPPKPEGLLTQNEELWEPLYACYQSLQACGMGIIANGDLLDTLRRVNVSAYRWSVLISVSRAPAIPKRWAS